VRSESNPIAGSLSSSSINPRHVNSLHTTSQQRRGQCDHRVNRACTLHAAAHETTDWSDFEHARGPDIDHWGRSSCSLSHGHHRPRIATHLLAHQSRSCGQFTLGHRTIQPNVSAFTEALEWSARESSPFNCQTIERRLSVYIDMSIGGRQAGCHQTQLASGTKTEP